MDRYRFRVYLTNSLIEKGENKKVIDFFNYYPHYLNMMYAPNNWTPLMMACRFNQFCIKI